MSDFGFILVVFLIVVASVGLAVFYIKRETRKMIEAQKEELPLGMIKQDIENLRKKFENGYSKI
jgi:Flp pilus assembly protein TadB